MAEKKESKKSKRVLIALGAGVAVAGVAMASAAGLGGLQADKLGADTAVVLSGYTDGLTVQWEDPAVDPMTGAYSIDHFTVLGGGPLPDARFTAALTNKFGATIIEAEGAGDGLTQVLQFDLAQPIKVEDLTGISILLTQGPI